MLGQMKDMYKLQQQAKQIKQELDWIHIKAEIDWVVVMMTAWMDLASIEYPDDLMEVSKKEKLADATKKAIEKAKKKAEEVSAEKMKAVMWWMWLPWM